MMPGPIQQRLSRYQISIDVTHVRLSERLGPQIPLCFRKLRESYLMAAHSQMLDAPWLHAERRHDRTHQAERTLEVEKVRVAFQGEAGAFSEAAAVQLYGENIVTVPRPTFDATFRAITEGHADALLVPIEMNLIGCPGASLSEIRSVSSHPMALAQCERFFGQHPSIKRLPAEDTAGSVREMLARGDRTHAAIAGKYAADRYRGEIIAERIQDNAENFTRFVFLQPVKESTRAFTLKTLLESSGSHLMKMTLAIRLAHRPGSLLASLEPLAQHRVNLLEIESRPIHGQPWEYQFFIDLEGPASYLEDALTDLRKATREVRVLGLYAAAQNPP